MSTELREGRSPRQEQQVSLTAAIAEVWRVAMPLMISTGTFSLVLFADRTLLLKYDGASMSAAMTGGNLFWVFVCLPMGIVSMTGAIVSQYVGAGKPELIGRFLWQSIWISISFTPCFIALAFFAPWIFRAAGQPESLIELDSIYFRILMIGAVGQVLETALSGFFSGTERTGTVMWVSIVSGLINLMADYVLIFGMFGFPEMGIKGAAIASVISFWFKVAIYAWLLIRPRLETMYQFSAGRTWDRGMLMNLIFFGFPTGLMYLNEAGAFTVMVRRIGTLGEVPLRATTMAINFNMIAFIPLIGVSIAASVLVGRHLTETGPDRAAKSVAAAMAIGWVYSSLWMIAFLTIGDLMFSLYEFNSDGADSALAIQISRGLLGFVAIYVVLDATQLILAGALRGAGDTWFVLFGGIAASAIALSIGFAFEPSGDATDFNVGLNWWWTVLTLWVCLLAVMMAIRFATGQWRKMRMVD